jgi:hypothetical protein
MDSSTEVDEDTDDEEDEDEKARVKAMVQARVFVFSAVHLNKRMNKRVGQSLASFAGKTSLLAAELEGVHDAFQKIKAMYEKIEMDHLSGSLTWEVESTMSDLKGRYSRFFRRWKIEHLIDETMPWP